MTGAAAFAAATTLTVVPAANATPAPTCTAKATSQTVSYTESGNGSEFGPYTVSYSDPIYGLSHLEPGECLYFDRHYEGRYQETEHRFSWTGIFAPREYFYHIPDDAYEGHGLWVRGGEFDWQH